MARCDDSRSVRSVQPHQVTMLPSCAFLQLMGALMHARKKVMMVTCCGMLCLQSSASRSSTYSHARWLKVARSACTMRSIWLPALCHQYALNFAPKWQTT